MTRPATFPVVMWEDPDGGFVVRCPVLEGCISQGDTREEALANICEAIVLCLDALDDDEAAFIPAAPELLTVAC